MRYVGDLAARLLPLTPRVIGTGGVFLVFGHAVPKRAQSERMPIHCNARQRSLAANFAPLDIGCCVRYPFPQLLACNFLRAGTLVS